MDHPIPAGYDARRIPARPDIAAAHLEGHVASQRFVSGKRMEVMAPVLPVKKEPGFDKPLETEAIRGEYVMVYETGEEGWSWGQLEADGYVGWIPSETLARPTEPQTHNVSVVRTFAYPGPSMKLPVVASFTLGSRFAIVERKDGFARSSDGLFFYADHLAPIGEAVSDFVATAETFLHTPYLWGGKTGFGIDCSGLVQVALATAGIAAPRDSDMQAAELGEWLDHDVDHLALQRGDLIRWKGHCGIMLDSLRLLHANGHHMMVAVEPLGEAMSRIAANSYGAVTGIARLKKYSQGA